MIVWIGEEEVELEELISQTAADVAIVDALFREVNSFSERRLDTLEMLKAYKRDIAKISMHDIKVPVGLGRNSE